MQAKKTGKKQFIKRWKNGVKIWLEKIRGLL